MHPELQRLLNKFTHSKEISYQDWNEFLNTRLKLGDQANLSALTLLLHLADHLQSLPEEAHLDIYLMLLRLSPEHLILTKKDLITLYVTQLDALYHANPNQPKTTKQISAYITKVMLFHEALTTHHRSPAVEKELFNRCLELSSQQLLNSYLDYCLGWMNYYGIGTALNVRFAMSFFHQAVEKQSTLALYGLATCCMESMDRSKQVLYMFDAAKTGNPESQLLYAENCHRRGLKLRNGESEEAKKKFQESISWCEKAANQGHPEAQYELGRFYDNKAGGKKDLHKAMHWYNQAEQQGHIDAITRLASIYAHGGDDYDQDVVEQSFDKSIMLYNRGIAQNDARALLGLMEVYLFMHSESKAIELFKILSKYNGHNEAEEKLIKYAKMYRSAEVMFAIGDVYERNKNVHPRDKFINNRPFFRTDNNSTRESESEKKMLEWYEEAANLGHSEAKSRLKPYHQKQLQFLMQFKKDEASVAQLETGSLGKKMN